MVITLLFGFFQLTDPRARPVGEFADVDAAVLFQEVGQARGLVVQLTGFDTDAFLLEDDTVAHVVFGDQSWFPVGRPHLVNADKLAAHLPDFVHDPSFVDQIPSVTESFALDIGGDSSWANDGDDAAHANVVSQQSVKVAKVIDMGVGDENSPKGFAVSCTEVAGASAIKKVGPRVVVWTGEKAHVFTDMTFIFGFDH